MKEVWPKAKRQVCVWYIIRDFARKAKECLSEEELSNFVRRCWKIVKSEELAFPVAIPSTTSLLERENKEFRRRVYPMDSFSSEEGAKNFTALWVEMRNLQQQGIDWVDGIMGVVW